MEELWPEEKKKDKINVFQVFFLFFKIGAFTIGGGYAMIPLIRNELVDKKKWITGEAFLDNLAVSQSLPGPIVVNFSLMTGYRLLGIKGSLFCLLGTILPSFLIILCIALFLWGYRDNRFIQAAFSGIRPAVVALIASAAYKLGKEVFQQRKPFFLFCVFLLVLILFRLHPIAIIVSGAVIGLIWPMNTRS